MKCSETIEQEKQESINTEELDKLRSNFYFQLEREGIEMFNALEADMRKRIIELDKANKQLKTEIKHKNQLWKTAFKAYKNLKNKVENKHRILWLVSGY